MSIKSKWLSLILASLFTVGMMFTVIFSAISKKISIDGRVSFEIADVNAKVSASISGAVETTSLKPLRWSKTEQPTKSDINSWSDLKLSFAKSKDIVITFFVENLSDTESLYVYFDDNAKYNYRVDKKLTHNFVGYNGDAIEITRNNWTTFELSFSFDKENYAIYDYDFDCLINLTDEKPVSDGDEDFIVSSDEELGNVVNSTIEGDVISFEIEKKDDAKFVGIRNLRTGKFEKINTASNSGQIMIFMIYMLDGDLGIEQEEINNIMIDYIDTFIDYSAIYNNDILYQKTVDFMSEVSEEEIKQSDEAMPGLLTTIEAILNKSMLYEYEIMDNADMYEAVFTSSDGVEGVEDGYTYKTFEDAGISIIKSFTLPDGASSDIAIPQTLGGQTVVGISPNLNMTGIFEGDITSLKVHDDLVNLGLFTFQNNTTLKTVELGKGLTSTGLGTFSDCTALETVSGENLTEIGLGAFSNCENLVSVYTARGITSVDASGFSGCEKLKSVFLGKLRFINNSAFSDCKVLEVDVEFAEGVTRIAQYSFSNCVSIKNMKIPSTIRCIEFSAFEGCDFLNYNIYNGGRYLGNEVNPYTLMWGVEDKTLETYTINENCKIIFGAFADCTALNSITIPNNIIQIGDRSFSKCTSLKSITIPNSVEYIGEYTFAGSGIENIIIPDSVKAIFWHSFADCVSLKTVELGVNITDIESYMFDGCTSLTTVTVKTSNFDGTINSGAFFDCKNLTNFQIPQGTTFIGMFAFANCSKITNIVVPDTVETIGGYAFTGCSSLKSITIEAVVPPSISKETLSSYIKEIKVPEESLDAYKTADIWVNYANIIVAI